MSAPKNRSKRQLILESDSDECEKLNFKVNTDETSENLRRSSSRLHSKRQRQQFKLPTRDEIWQNIPSLKSPEKLSRITPRKSISNFTKVYNTYNFDDYEDTGDEESGSESSSSSNDETPRRVKNYHKRIVIASSSSDEDNSVSDPGVKHPQLHNDLNQDTSNPDNDKKDKYPQREGGTNSTTEKIISEDFDLEVQTRSRDSGLDKINQDCVSESLDSSNSDDNDDCIAKSQRLNCSAQRCILSSDDESDGETESSTSPAKAEPSNQRFHRSSSLKEKQQNLFSDFRDAIAKRKSRSSNSQSN